MALVNKSKAARLAGVSRTTIHRYIKSGKLSAAPGGEIDTSELLRVFGSLKDDSPVTPETVATEQSVTPPQLPDLTSKIRELENQVVELKQDRDSWREQAQANHRLLEDKSRQDERITSPTGDPSPLEGTLVVAGQVGAVLLITIGGLMLAQYFGIL